MTNTTCRYLLGLLLLGGALPQTWGQTSTFDEPDWNTAAAREAEQRIERKSGSLFLRTQRNEPGPQLAYAHALAEAGELGKAARQYNALVHAWPESEEAAEAQLAYARILLQRGKYEKAFEELQYLIEYHQGQFPYNAVLQLQREAAAAVKSKRWGQFLFLPGFQSPERAIPLYRRIIQNGPNGQDVPALRMEIGQIHEEANQYEEAIQVYETILVQHSRHPLAQQAIFRKAWCLKHLADKNPRDERRLRDALSALFAVLRSEPDPELAREAQALLETLRTRLEHLYWEQVRFYDQIKQDREAALLSYRSFLEQFPRSGRVGQVTRRIRELEAEQAERKEP